MNKRLLEIKKTLQKFISNFEEVSEGEQVFIFEGENIYEGLDVNTRDADANIIPVPDGEYTIKGVKVQIEGGKVTKLPEKENHQEPPKNAPESKEKDGDDKTPTIEELNDLRAENDRLKAENDTMRAELEELKKKPLATPVPQVVKNNANGDTPDVIKGTRYEKAFKVFGSK